MKKIVAVLLLLLVASAFVFAKTCPRCEISYSGSACPKCKGFNMAVSGSNNTCSKMKTTAEAYCNDGYIEGIKAMSGSTSEAEE